MTVVGVDTQGWSKYEPGDKTEDGEDRDISPVKKGYGIGISSIKVVEGVSLYSSLVKHPNSMRTICLR